MRHSGANAKPIPALHRAASRTISAIRQLYVTTAGGPIADFLNSRAANSAPHSPPPWEREAPYSRFQEKSGCGAPRSQGTCRGQTRGFSIFVASFVGSFVDKVRDKARDKVSQAFGGVAESGCP